MRALRAMGHSEFAVFFEPDAIAINNARLDHLASLGLPLSGKSVLEVGAGIGLLSHFFEERACKLIITDGNPNNVREMLRRFPHREAQLLDLNAATDLSFLGRFQIIFCYGTLYHLSKPEQALRTLASVCDEMILLETCVALGKEPDIRFIKDWIANNQATSGIGCRPTRSWVMGRLRQDFGHSYIPRTQPRHPDFVLDWRKPPDQLLYRSVFIGSKHPLRNPNLLEEIPEHQQN